MLHIIPQSLYKNPPQLSAPMISEADAVLLMGDGLYNSTHPMMMTLKNLFAIDEDRVTRGLHKQTHIQYISYAEMVTLTEHQNPIVTWS
jgi:sulfur relay protein TusB/DsrH